MNNFSSEFRVNNISILLRRPHCIKVYKYGVFSGPYFPVSGLNTKIYFVNLHIQSKYEKYGPEKTPYLGTFHAVSTFTT